MSHVASCSVRVSEASNVVFRHSWKYWAPQVLIGMPCCKKWSKEEPEKPLYCTLPALTSSSSAFYSPVFSSPVLLYESEPTRTRAPPAWPLAPP